MNEHDWAEFRKLFPKAAAFIDKRDLQREKERLTVELKFLEIQSPRYLASGDNLKRLTWVKDRLKELANISLPPEST